MESAPKLRGERTWMYARGSTAKYALWHILSAVYEHHVRVAPEPDVNTADPVTLTLHRCTFLVT